MYSIGRTLFAGTVLIVGLACLSLSNPPSKYTLFVFEGSDWCRICLRLEEKVLSTEAFVNFAEEKEIEVIRLDFPQRKSLDKDQEAFNISIAEKYGFDGSFPTLMLVKTENDKVLKIPYKNEDLSAFLSLIINSIEANP